MYVCMDVWMYVCMYVWMYVCVSVVCLSVWYGMSVWYAYIWRDWQFALVESELDQLFAEYKALNSDKAPPRLSTHILQRYISLVIVCQWSVTGFCL